MGQSVGQGAEDAAQQAAGSGGRYSSGQEGRAHQEASGLRPGGGDQEGRDHPVNKYTTCKFRNESVGLIYRMIHS